MMANKKRLIDANKLKWKLGQVTLYVKGLRFGKTVLSKILESYRRAVFEEIDEAPTVDAVEVVHGRWVKGGYVCGETEWKCSICNETEWRTSADRLSYCPFCGAKMDGEDHG